MSELANEFEVERPLVCVQGLGFVGTAMAVAVASAKRSDGTPRFNVVGVDLPNPVGQERIDNINKGVLPLETIDQKLLGAFENAHQQGNFVATSDTSVYEKAEVILVDIHLDLDFSQEQPSIAFSGFKAAIRTLGERISPNCLIVVETTVPPGTCEKVVFPLLTKEFQKRGITTEPQVAHSYERVMPGADYFESIVDFWRVFAGVTPSSADACEQFLSSVINVEEYPLSRLHSTTASETGKVLENSYRATTIAFMEEWGRFAEAVGVDLFQVIDAIRKRPTHSNMRQPGFGVGGYCLTKDPLFAKLAAKEIFELEGHDFPFCTSAVATNNVMPLVTLGKLVDHFGDLSGKRILMLGVSYRQDVGDTRYSPSETFVKAAQERGASLVCHDPLIDTWEELEIDVLNEELPSSEGYDAIVLTVPHREYMDIDFCEWLEGSEAVLVDANCILNADRIQQLRNAKKQVISIGRGN